MNEILKKTGLPVNISKNEVFRTLQCTPESEAYSVFEEEYEELLAVSRYGADNDVYLDAPCGGKGRCGKCLVQVTEGVLPAGEEEKKLIPSEKLEEGWRLACLAVPQMNVGIRIPENEERFQVLASGQEKKAGSDGRSGWGIAVDIGTIFGGDVISRIEASLKGEKERLRESVSF